MRAQVLKRQDAADQAFALGLIVASLAYLAVARSKSKTELATAAAPPSSQHAVSIYGDNNTVDLSTNKTIGQGPTTGDEAAADALTGLSLHMWIKVNNAPAERRKYLLAFGKKDRERFSIYISPDNIFTISFVDAKGEPHPIQVPTDAKGLPLGALVYLGCEVGVSDGTTVLRMIVKGRREELPRAHSDSGRILVLSTCPTGW